MLHIPMEKGSNHGSNKMFAFYFGIALLATASITGIAFGIFAVMEIIAIFYSLAFPLE